MAEIKAFIGSLPWSCDDNALYEKFATFGEVYEARVAWDRDSDRSKGFGFVTFATEEGLAKAVEAGAEIDGRTLNVRKCEPKPTDGSRPERSNECFAFKKGECTRGDGCRFSHAGEGSSAPAGTPMAKTGTCFAFQKGNCFRGDSCRFNHEGAETKTAEVAAPAPSNKTTFGDAAASDGSSDEAASPTKKRKAEDAPAADDDKVRKKAAKKFEKKNGRAPTDDELTKAVSKAEKKAAKKAKTEN
jgi:RNA-binding motif X-linked protein 2